MAKSILIEAIKYASGPILLCIIIYLRRKWPKLIGLFQPDKVQAELVRDRATLEALLTARNEEIKQLKGKDARREIAFEELFDQVQGYRLVRDKLQRMNDDANVLLVKIQQDLDTEGPRLLKQ